MIKRYTYFCSMIKKQRNYQIRTFLQFFPSHIISRNHPIILALKTIRPDYELRYDLIINRWVLYKRAWPIDDKWAKYAWWWIHCRTLHNPKTLDFREPGDWLLQSLRKEDLLAGGGISFREMTKKVEEDLDKLCPAEINLLSKLKDIYQAINDDMKLIGRTSVLPFHSGSASVERKKGKRIFVGMRTGKVLGVR